MKNILICNQKGGVGKSLVADELAFSFERSQIPISFFDLDSQGGTLHPTSRKKDAQAAVIDTPGALQRQLGDWIAHADLIVIPTRTTSRDIEPLMRMRKAVDAGARPGVPVVYVLNGWNRWRASSDFLAWLKGSAGIEPGSLARLPQSEQFVQASAAGRSVVEHARHSSAAKAALELCGLVRRLSGFPAEK